MIDRAYMPAHVGRQQREREIRTTTAPIRQTRSRAWTATALAVMAWAGAAGGRDATMLIVALGMTVIAAILFRLSRRPL